MSDETNKKSKAEIWIQIIGLIVGIIAIALTAYFSIRSERNKEVSVTYVAKRPLVSIDGTRTSTGLAISIDGNPVAEPWLVSGKLENSGSQPIEERDIETQATLFFSNAKIVAAEIVQKSQPGIYAAATFGGPEVIVHHKLLNPGDWIAFDIVFDGEPQIPPVLSLRISGVTAPNQRVVSFGERAAYPAIVTLPNPVIYLALVIGSITGVSFIIGAWVMLAQRIRKRIRNVSTDAAAEVRFGNSFEPGILSTTMTAQSKEGRTIHAFLDNKINIELLDDVNAMAETIRAHVPIEVLQALHIEARNAALQLTNELRTSVVRQLGSQIYLNLPRGVDEEARKTFNGMNIQSMSMLEMIAAAKELTTKASVAAPRKKKNGSSDVIAECLILIIGVALIVILGGTWRTMLLG